ncbi:MAG TPA: PGPGW domain-containing protein [Candidatus Acidoferrales bacterium]|nr:PGPGW domain-containing protein [Candidatus Acidoferrales bacterium]
MFIKTVEQAKRWFKIVGGFTLLVIGVATMFSPAPGFLIMLLGLGILAAEFVWARRLLNHLKEQGEKLRQNVFTRSDKMRPAVVTVPLSAQQAIGPRQIGSHRTA